MTTPKVLFILKRREDYSTDIPYFCYMQVATGMFNSANFVSDALIAAGIESKVMLADDANRIDSIVRAEAPTHVFIEGYWVVPEKFDELRPLHPLVKWIVRCHSELPFLAQEGIAIGWTFDYLQRGVRVSGNSPRINREIQMLAKAVHANAPVANTPMLPNFYPVEFGNEQDHVSNGYFNIGCFGAIRPMKNHLSQAIAAYEFCRKHNLNLRFHVNAGRVEMYGQNPLKNIRSLFANLPGAELVEHDWASHELFLEIVGSMDMLMQVSFTETFNIVAADAVNQNVPVVASNEISWLHPIYADPTSTESMVLTLEKVWKNRDMLVKSNKVRLHKFGQRSIKHWLSFLAK